MDDERDQRDELIGNLLRGLPRERTHLLSSLLVVQHALRHLPLWALERVADYLRVPKSEVYGVATHFPLLRLEEPGRAVVRVCIGVSCQVNGGRDLLASLEAAYGVTIGGTSADGAVTLEETPCAFLCSVAPAVEVEGRGCGRATVERVQEAVRRCGSATT